MKIKSSEYVTSAVRPSQYLKGDLPEIAFLGRSNVGKSSLINSLLNRKRLAQTSKAPGKTRMLNFYLVNGSFVFVDLPGYGYAKVSRSVHAAWSEMIEGYLSRRGVLRLLVLLVDLRHPPSKLDREMKLWISRCRCPSLVIATKADKVGSSRRAAHLKMLRNDLSLSTGENLILYSSSSGLGRQETWDVLENYLPVQE